MGDVQADSKERAVGRDGGWPNGGYEVARIGEMLGHAKCIAWRGSVDRNNRRRIPPSFEAAFGKPIAQLDAGGGELLPLRVHRLQQLDRFGRGGEDCGRHGGRVDPGSGVMNHP